MSSILEALRELEAERARPAGQVTIADVPSEAPRAMSPLIPLAGGLAVGFLAFTLYVVWRSGLLSASAPDVPAAEPPRAERTAVSRPADPGPTGGATPRRPAWLDRAEAPRARVAAAPEPAPAAPAREGTGRRAPARIEVESIAFAGDAARRAVTVRVDGRRLTLRQQERVGDLDVHLIMPDGVYFQRGGEVFLVKP